MPYYDVEITPELARLRNVMSKIFPQLYVEDDSVKVSKGFQKKVAALLKIATNKLYDMNVTNMQYIPKEGPTIQVSWHSNFFDPFWMLPYSFETNELEIVSLALEDLFNPEYLVFLLRGDKAHHKLESVGEAFPSNWFFRRAGAIPIERSGEKTLDDLIEDAVLKTEVRRLVDPDGILDEITMRDILKLTDEDIERAKPKMKSTLRSFVEYMKQQRRDTINKQFIPMLDSLSKGNAALIFPQGGRFRGEDAINMKIKGLDILTSIRGVEPLIAPSYIGEDKIGLRFLGNKTAVNINFSVPYVRNGANARRLEHITRRAMQGAYVAAFDDVLGAAMVGWADSWKKNKALETPQILDMVYSAIKQLSYKQTALTPQLAHARQYRDASLAARMEGILLNVGDSDDWEKANLKDFQNRIRESGLPELEARMAGAIAYLERRDYIERDEQGRFKVAERLEAKPEYGRNHEKENILRNRAHRLKANTGYELSTRLVP